MTAIILYAILMLTFVHAQGCGKDVLVDDFSTKQSKFFENALRQINLLGGDYGTDGKTTFDIDTDAKTLTVIPKENENVFFFAKYDEGACFDLTKFYAFQFDLLAPEGATGTFTLTQKSDDCSVRVDDGDSTYVPLSKYYTTPGQKQTVIMPFADFTALASGNGSYDFEHLKDWTFVDPKPLGEPFVFSNMKLLGGAPGCDGTVPETTNGTTTNSTTNGTSTVVTSGNLTGSNATSTETPTPSTAITNLPASNEGHYTSFSLWILIVCVVFV